MALNLAATIRLDNGAFISPLDVATRGVRRLTGSLAAAAAGYLSLRAAAAQVAETFAVISDFGDAMARVGAISGATSEELAAMERTARELGATTMFSASEAAEGMTFLAMAGFSVRDSIDSLPQVLSLAQAGALDLGRAADIASNIMSSFGIQARDLGTVVDDLATVAASANTNVEQLGHGISFAGPLASAFGISLQETLAALGVLGDVGMGKRAGEQVASIFRRLTQNTAESRRALEEMGLTMADIDPTANSLTQILTKLRGAGMTPQQATAMFGEAAAGILALTGQLPKLQELTAAMDENTGTAEEMARRMGDSLAGDVREMESAVEELRLTLGDLGATDFFRGIVRGFTDLVLQVTQGVRLVGVAMSQGRIGELFGATLKAGAAEAINFLVRGGTAFVTGLTRSLELLPERMAAIFQVLADPNFWTGVADVAIGAFQGLGAALLKIFARPLNWLQAAMDTLVQGLLSALNHVPGLRGKFDGVEVKSMGQNLREREAEGGTLLQQLADQSLAESGARMKRGAALLAGATDELFAVMKEQSIDILQTMAAEWENAPDLIDSGPLKDRLREIVGELAQGLEAADLPGMEGGEQGGTGQPPAMPEDAPGAPGDGLAAIMSDRLARIGGFIGPAGGPAVDYARRTADNTRKMIAQLEQVIRGQETSAAATWG